MGCFSKIQEKQLLLNSRPYHLPHHYEWIHTESVWSYDRNYGDHISCYSFAISDWQCPVLLGGGGWKHPNIAHHVHCGTSTSTLSMHRMHLSPAKSCKYIIIFL